MKYVIIYTVDGDWETVDAVLVESDTNPVDMPDEELASIFEADGIDYPQAMAIVEDGMWFARNTDDVDVSDMDGEIK